MHVPDQTRLDSATNREDDSFQGVSGVPCIRGLRYLRVTVGMVLGQLAGGRTIDEVLGDYPYLERADVLAALEYASVAGSRSRFA